VNQRRDTTSQSRAPHRRDGAFDGQPSLAADQERMAETGTAAIISRTGSVNRDYKVATEEKMTIDLVFKNRLLFTVGIEGGRRRDDSGKWHHHDEDQGRL